MKEEFFETKEFSISTSAYVRSVLFSLLYRWCWVPILMLVICVILALMLNTAFLYVALILIFLIIPTSLMFVYFVQSTTIEARIAILRKKISIDNSGITVDFAPIKRFKYENEDSCNDELIEIPPSYIPRQNVIGVENLGNTVRIYLNGGKYKFISIPLEVVEGDCDAFLAFILHYKSDFN